MIVLLKPPFSAGISWLARFDYQRASASVQHRNCFRIHTTSTKKLIAKLPRGAAHSEYHPPDERAVGRGWWKLQSHLLCHYQWIYIYTVGMMAIFDARSIWRGLKYGIPAPQWPFWVRKMMTNHQNWGCLQQFQTNYLHPYIIWIIYHIISLSHYIPPSMYGFSMLFCSGHQAKCSTA